MGLQAIIFNKKSYSVLRAKDYLWKHGLKPIKEVHTTKNFHRFRLEDPRRYNRYMTKPIGRNIKLVIGLA